MHRPHLLTGFVLALVWKASLAGALQLEPVAVHVLPNERDASLTIRNLGAEPLLLAARVLSWQQHGGNDALAPTEEVAISPPQFEIPPGGKQRLRVVQLSNQVADQERCYRIIVDELGSGLRSRYSLPVFVRSLQKEPHRLEADLSPVDDENTQLLIRNPTKHHVKLVDLSYLAPDGTKRVLMRDLAGYVLPESGKQWILKGPIASYRTGHFSAIVNGHNMGFAPPNP